MFHCHCSVIAWDWLQMMTTPSTLMLLLVQQLLKCNARNFLFCIFFFFLDFSFFIISYNSNSDNSIVFIILLLRFVVTVLLWLPSQLHACSMPIFTEWLVSFTTSLIVRLNFVCRVPVGCYVSCIDLQLPHPWFGCSLVVATNEVSYLLLMDAVTRERICARSIVAT